MYVDFNEVKALVSIEQAAQRLNLKLTKSSGQYRAPCPYCKSGGDRALAITPAKNLYYCFAAQKGGDQIALVAHVRDESPKDAAQWLHGLVHATSTVPSTSTSKSKDHAEGFQPLDYLEPGHDAVQAVGFDPETAQALGIGFAPKGILRGLVAIPVRLEDGSLAGYIGITEAKLPSKWHLPASNVVPIKKGVA